VDLGYPPPEVNWSIRDIAGVELYRLDLAWPDHRISIEYNGYAEHAGREIEDEQRAVELRRRGWIVIVATKDDLSDSQRLDRALREAFERRGYRWWANVPA
jgi:very-short-patch-repair endonuclease